MLLLLLIAETILVDNTLGDGWVGRVWNLFVFFFVLMCVVYVILSCTDLQRY